MAIPESNALLITPHYLNQKRQKQLQKSNGIVTLQDLRKMVQSGMKSEHLSVDVLKYGGARSGVFRPECAVLRKSYIISIPCV
ncbi:hypothetical protein JNM87_02810 [Candidatus Saccharibacteria bacterium]|nr:hypothetical protein [Candidatus Saccharibacteria bacterium]